MKKISVFLLSSALLLFIAGCGIQEPAPITEAVTEESPSASPSVPSASEAPEYPDSLEAEIFVEGEPQTLTLDLFDGGNYVIYIPGEDFTLETTLEDGYLTDRWTNIYLDEIWFSVISLGSMEEEEARQYLLRRYQDWQFSPPVENQYCGTEYTNFTFLNFMIHSDQNRTFALVAHYPMDAGDGYAPRTETIMSSFAVKPG